jgi:hypothetical protein
MTSETLKRDHRDRYRYPNVVVFCKLGDPGGYPYANQQYRKVAELYAAQVGGVIEEWDETGSGFFTIGGRGFQVVADRRCIDVIRRPIQEYTE